MSYTATGKLHILEPVQRINDKFNKRNFVLEIKDGKYPQLVQFELFGDKCADIDPCKEGDEIQVSFDLRGREWTSPKGEVRYFNTLSAWKIQREASSPAAEPPPIGDEDEPLPF